MGKTISLKLNLQEEYIIDSMRKKGVSPSSLLRKALWNYIQEKNGNKQEKEYKEVNPVNLFFKEKKKNEEQKGYKEVNQINQMVNQVDDSLQEKEVYQPVNQSMPTEHLFLQKYITQLQTNIQRLEHETNEWKLRYAAETQFWKEAFRELQVEYQNQVKDSTKRIDEKFDRIMFYFEEIRKTPFSADSASDVHCSEKQKKKSTFQMFRM